MKCMINLEQIENTQFLLILTQNSKTLTDKDETLLQWTRTVSYILVKTATQTLELC